MNKEILEVKRFFSSLNVHSSDVWLESCINWCKAEILGANPSSKELQSKVYEQWLLLDLRDVEVRVLPPDLSDKEHYNLQGNFCLQMMHIVDISKPKLWQLQKIRNNNALTRDNNDEAAVAGTGKRVLQLKLTDGVQEVEAVEYQPISCLSLTMPPGIKIRLIGPVVIRRGRLLLDQHNIKVLGGEVEELLVTNAVENVLARALKMPENSNPKKIEEKMLSVEVDDKQEGFATLKKINKPVVPSLEKKLKKEAINLDEDEEMLMSKEIDMLLEAESEHNQIKTSNASKTPDLFEDGAFDAADFDRMDVFTSTQVCKVGAAGTNSVPKPPDEEDVFEDIDVDEQFALAEKQTNVTDSTPNIITIDNIVRQMHNEKIGTFYVRVKFKEVVEKLTFSEAEYKIVIRVQDSQSNLVVRVDSDIIADFAGYTAAAIMTLKDNILNKDKIATETVMNALQRVKDKLLRLDNVVEIKLGEDCIPSIIKII